MRVSSLCGETASSRSSRSFFRSILSSILTLQMMAFSLSCSSVIALYPAAPLLQSCFAASSSISTSSIWSLATANSSGVSPKYTDGASEVRFVARLGAPFAKKLPEAGESSNSARVFCSLAFSSRYLTASRAFARASSSSTEATQRMAIWSAFSPWYGDFSFAGS